MLSKLGFLVAAGSALGRRLTVRNERCLRSRHRKSDCRACSRVCPTGALASDDDLSLSSDLCSGCGACAAVCPAGALAATAPSDEEVRLQIARHVKNSGAVAFACERHLSFAASDRAKVVAVPCLARLDETILVEAALVGASTVVLVDMACAACPQNALRRVAEAAVANADDLLSPWRRRGTICIGKEPPELKPLADSRAVAPGVSRRALFSAFRPAKVEAVQSSPPQPPRSERGAVTLGFDGRPQEAPERLRRLVEGLRHLGPPSEDARCTSSLFGAVTVSAGCNGCGICAEVCPTGALVTREDDAGWRLIFLAGICNRCGLCENVCFAKALMLDGESSMAAILRPTPSTLVTKSKIETGELTAPLDERFSRLFGCQVTS